VMHPPIIDLRLRPPVGDVQESLHDFLGLGWRSEIIQKILWTNAPSLPGVA